MTLAAESLLRIHIFSFFHRGSVVRSSGSLDVSHHNSRFKENVKLAASKSQAKLGGSESKSAIKLGGRE
jgi:hypothetical protein